MGRSAVAVLYTLSCAVAVIACGKADGDASPSTDTHEDAPGAADATLGDERPITLTLPKVVGSDLSDAGLSPPFDIGGAQVCLIRERPLNGAFSEFVETDDNCVTTVAGEPSVLLVPPRRELLVTVHADGYRPLVVPVVSGSRDTSATFTPLFLVSNDATGALVSLRSKPERGDFFVCAVAVRSARWAYLAGARIWLEPTAGAGPYYNRGGVLDEGSVTPAGDDIETVLDQTTVPGASFFDIPEGEYRVRISHPRATCQAFGFNGAQLKAGFPDSENALRVPVLDGHTTSTVVFECRCDIAGLSSAEIAAVDPGTCLVADAGLPEPPPDASH